MPAVGGNWIVSSKTVSLKGGGWNGKTKTLYEELKRQNKADRANVVKRISHRGNCI